MNQSPPASPISRARIAQGELAELIASGLEETSSEARRLALEALGICLELTALLAQSTATINKE